MDNENNHFCTKTKIFFVIGGVLVGFLSGFFGGGGGMLVVPLLTYLGKLEEKESHATAIAVILPLTVVSGVVYVLKGAYDLQVGIPVGIGFVVGGIIGSFVLKKLNGKVLCVIFTLVMIAGGIKLIW
ncbi:MAG: sulfite exporter TauE/SafE family protein [Clostridia bacterium]|nr:sulfite exporter TauE/SafE family protein [Clostridia bacterium]